MPTVPCLSPSLSLYLPYVDRLKSQRPIPSIHAIFNCCLRMGALHETNNKTDMNDLKKQEGEEEEAHEFHVWICVEGKKKTKRLALFMSFSDHIVCL